MGRFAILIVAVTVAAGCATGGQRSQPEEASGGHNEGTPVDLPANAAPRPASEAGSAQYMNNQMQELEQSLAREHELGDAVVENSDNKEGIKVSISSRAAFGAGSDEIKPSFREVLDRLSTILLRYPKTSLMIVGHTDSQGATDYNQLLSERRAKVLSDYLCSKGIDSTRVRYVGKGATEPVASNATAAGRSVNARLEIIVKPLPVLSGR